MPVMGLQPFQRPQMPPAAPMAQAPAMPAPMAPAPAAPQQPGYLSNVVQMGVRRQGIRTAENARRRAAILAHMSGLDPNQARVARLNSENSISGGLSDALNQGTLQGALSDQSYGRQQADRLQGRQWMLADRAHDEQRQKFSIGGALGSLVGQGLGAYAGGLGARLGAGRQPRSAYDRTG